MYTKSLTTLKVGPDLGDKTQTKRFWLVYYPTAFFALVTAVLVFKKIVFVPPTFTCKIFSVYPNAWLHKLGCV